MIFWEILPDIAWALAILLLLWVLVDLILTSKKYDEDYLMSAIEGSDELVEQQQAHEQWKSGGATGGRSK